MKRCPQCNRVETDDALGFCRVDGTALISDSASLGAIESTERLGSRSVASEIKTSILPHSVTDPDKTGPTARTTALPASQRASTTRDLVGLKRGRGIVVASAAIVIVIGGFVYFNHVWKTQAAINSVAVLPFQNASGDPNIEYLSDGMAESLMDSLSQLPNLRVMSRSTAFRYKNKDQDVQKVGNELNVRAVLTGSLKQVGDQIVVSVSLDDASDSHHIWGAQYDRKLSDLLSVQREIARDITGNLRLKLSGTDESRVTKHYTEDPGAYQLYLKGRFYWNKRTGEALKKSIEYFNQAIDKDPNYALAYAGLADAYVLFPPFSAGSPQESFPKAKAAARKALEIDDRLAEAHTSLAFAIFLWDWNLSESEREFQKALELNPNYATAHHWRGTLLRTTGQFDEAIAEEQRALKLDPLSLIINSDLGQIYLWAGQYEKAIEQLRKTIEMDQNFYYAHVTLGMAYESKGNYQDALAEYQKARMLNDDPLVLALLGHVYAASGRRGEALRALDQLKEIAKVRNVTVYSFALLYTGLGDKDQAFQWLEKGYQDHAYNLLYIKVYPFLDNLRSDPRYADLVRRVGLPQ